MKLPALRMNLDFMPSPLPDRPGLLIRDPYQFSDSTLIIPPPLVESLRFFDGEHTDLDLREWLVRRTGELEVSGFQQQLVETLSRAGFFHDENYERLRTERMEEFTKSPLRLPSHAGSAYPDDPVRLRETLESYLKDGGSAGPAVRHWVGIAAPHVSPEGGWSCYQAAYRAVTPEYRERTFVILGTSHYGEPDRFGLTRKNFLTPYGEAHCHTAYVERLAEAAPEAVTMEDYCHAIEHSIEFQVVFLQHLFGPDIRILPVLCGAFVRSVHGGGAPEQDDRVRRFFEALGELAAREGDRLFWVLGIDLAHMGRRYGDPYAAEANRGPMTDVATRDQQRLERIAAGDKRGFWELIQQNRDDLKWCGAACLYTLLAALPRLRAEVLRYEQWNIDPESVVSFAGLAFYQD